MRNTIIDLLLRIFPLTAIAFGVAIYGLMLHRHPDGIIISVFLAFLCGSVFGVGIGLLARTNEYRADTDLSPLFMWPLQMALLELGYRREHQLQKIVTYQPMLRAGIFADRIRIEFLQGGCRIEGPAHHVERLVAKLGV